MASRSGECLPDRNCSNQHTPNQNKLDAGLIRVSGDSLPVHHLTTVLSHVFRGPMREWDHVCTACMKTHCMRPNNILSKLVEAALVDLPFSGVKSSIAQSMLVDQGWGSWCQGQLHDKTSGSVLHSCSISMHAQQPNECAPSEAFAGSSQHIFAMKFLLLLPWLNFKNTQFLECNSLATRSKDVAHRR